ncbi:MAG: hypothetical protein ACI96P_000240 [Candidatus Azotimanducaceae bacterium]
MPLWRASPAFYSGIGDVIYSAIYKTIYVKVRQLV